VTFLSGVYMTTAELNYIVKTQERPRRFSYEPPDPSPRSAVGTEPHWMGVYDLQGEDHAFTLDGEGFVVVRHDFASPTFRMR
jgi:hypothetical protein